MIFFIVNYAAGTPHCQNADEAKYLLNDLFSKHFVNETVLVVKFFARIKTKREVEIQPKN